MKVLLAIDDSARSHVVDAAAATLWPSGTEFCVMSVVDMRHWEGLPQLVEDATREAKSLATRATEELAKSGHSAFSEIPAGSPKEKIIEYAKQWNADLVMVGSHGNGVATRFLLGSVAQAVLRAASCSVAIVRQSSQPQSQSKSQGSSRGTKILLATDGSESSAKAAASIAKRPWPAQSEIRIISVVQLLTADVPSLMSSISAPVPDLIDEIYKLGRTRGQEGIADARKTLSATGLTVSDATPIGEPRAMILDEAKTWGADLIVLGSHGRHGLDRLVMGSVAEAVASHAHCSVEVVR
jgi:nucleotide-binding universal stress UspA family protein